MAKLREIRTTRRAASVSRQEAKSAARYVTVRRDGSTGRVVNDRSPKPGAASKSK